MTITILTYYLGDITSGQARFANVLAGGLHQIGEDVSVLSSWATQSSLALLRSQGVQAATVHVGSPSETRKEFDIMYPKRVLIELRDELTRRERRDWVIVLSDELVAASSFLPPMLKTAYICQGDFMLLFLSDPFYRDSKLMKTVAATMAARRIRQHARMVKAYDLLLSNSRFTRDFISYFYGCRIDDVCYPPVDLDFFKPRGAKSKERHILCMSRNDREQGVEFLEELARHVPLKIVGKTRVNGAETLGRLSDEQLICAYSEASAVLSPVISEFFGYSIAESLATGTPVIAYSGCGPAELIQNGLNGWTAVREWDLISLAERVVNLGYDEQMSARARESVRHLAPREVAFKLRGLLESAPIRRGKPSNGGGG